MASIHGIGEILRSVFSPKVCDVHPKLLEAARKKEEAAKHLLEASEAIKHVRTEMGRRPRPIYDDIYSATQSAGRF